MTTFNTLSPRQTIKDQDYRGSYTQHLTLKQYEMLMLMIEKTDIDADALWEANFQEDYKEENWRNISVNAASELINHLVNIWGLQRAIMRKASRTEQEQHDYEMGWGW